MRIGNDALAAPKYIKEVIAAAYPGDVLGLFHRTFGDGSKALEEFAKSRKFFEIVDHLAPFDSSHRYDLKKNLPQIYKDAKFCEYIANAYPTNIIMISPFCEHQHPRRVMIPIFNELKRIAPSCVMVNSIWGRGEQIDGICTEIHIETTARLPSAPRGEYTVSLDGFGGNKRHPEAMVDADMQKVLIKYATARHIRAWGSRHNGKWDAIKDPAARDQRKHFPEVNYLRGYRMSLKVREGVQSYNKEDLLKTFSDDHGAKPPTKDNKLLVIIGKGGGDRIAEVFDSKGNKIDTMRRVLPDHKDTPKGRRYYSGKYAVEIADKAVKNTGSALIEIRSGSRRLPLIDGYLRSRPK